jgi:glutamate/tyrosine decarboxylase-like PLP-dependent enzyme
MKRCGSNSAHRFLDPKLEADEEDHDRFTEHVIAAILASGDAFFTATTWRGRKAMRVSVCNWQTSSKSVETVCQSVAAALHRGRTARLHAQNA